MKAEKAEISISIDFEKDKDLRTLKTVLELCGHFRSFPNTGPIKKMYFCLPLTRDTRQQDSKDWREISPLRINAKVDKEKVAEINQKLSRLTLAVSYLSNDTHDRAVLRLLA